MTSRPRSRGPLLAALGLGLVALAWWLLSSPYRGVKNLAAPGRAVVVLGDSIPAGFGDGVGADRAWPTLVARRLQLDLVNSSVPGDTTEGGLKRLDGAVLEHRPRLVIVELGGNDLLQRVDSAETQRNLEAIFARIQDRGAMVMFVAVPSPLGRYEEAFRAACSSRGVYYVPNILRGILSDRSRMFDTIHPNALGHETIADRLEPHVRGLLQAGDRARGG